MSALDARLQVIIDWIRERTDVEAGRGALVPVSGGSDSALGFWLCAQALPPGRAIGAFVGSGLRCRGWFEQFGPVRLLPEPLVSSHIETTRWALMLSLSLDVRGWLVGTRNRTEDVFGTYSLRLIWAHASARAACILRQQRRLPCCGARPEASAADNRNDRNRNDNNGFRVVCVHVSHG